MLCLICAPVRARALAAFDHHIAFSRSVSLPKILRGWDDCVRGVLPFPRLRVFISRKLF